MAYKSTHDFRKGFTMNKTVEKCCWLTLVALGLLWFASGLAVNLLLLRALLIWF